MKTQCMAAYEILILSLFSPYKIFFLTPPIRVSQSRYKHEVQMNSLKTVPYYVAVRRITLLVNVRSFQNIEHVNNEPSENNIPDSSTTNLCDKRE